MTLLLRESCLPPLIARICMPDLLVCADDTILTVKRRIAAAQPERRVSSLMLVHAGKALDNDRTLIDVGIATGAPPTVVISSVVAVEKKLMPW